MEWTHIQKDVRARDSNLSEKILQNKNIQYINLRRLYAKIRLSDQMLAFLLKTKNANNSNENRNKSCRDDDGTMAHGYNNQLPAKLNRWSDRGRRLYSTAWRSIAFRLLLLSLNSMVAAERPLDDLIKCFAYIVN